MSPVHPRSLSIQEPRPLNATWTCTEHGDLEPGEIECPYCIPADEDY